MTTPSSPAPVFMFGFERSGTTLLSMIVGAHPRIAVPLAATGLWYRYADRLGAYNDLAGTADLARLVDDLLAEERVRLWDETLPRDEILAAVRPGSYASVVAAFHAAYARAKGKDLWGNIEIETLDRMDDANRWFPDAKFVHIVRDGRDVALSHGTMPYGAANIGECGEVWRHRLYANLKMGAILGPERYHVVRYEDLVLDSETALRKMCAFIGVDYSADMLNYPEMVAAKIPEDKRWLWPDITRGPVATNVNRWKGKMTANQRIVFEGVAGDMLKRFGYESFETVPKKPGAYALEFWYFLGRGHRLNRLAAKLGLKRESKLERSWKKGGKAAYADTQKQAFGALVKDGAYSDDFEHPAPAKAFFEKTMGEALGAFDGDRSLAVLDAGCGPGAWLDHLSRLPAYGARRAETRLFGFDITPEMVEVAQRRLGDRFAAGHFKSGDVLADASYAFDAADKPFDVIYTYDVIQQLPPKLQFDGLRAMLKHLASDGVLVVFDHDKHSPYGRTMGRKKFLTQYCGLRLVPRYYCNAKYPPLTDFARRVEAQGGYACAVTKAETGNKQALVIRARGG